MEENISKAESDIKQNGEDQKAKETEISEQKKVVEEVKSRLDSVGK